MKRDTTDTPRDSIFLALAIMTTGHSYLPESTRRDTRTRREGLQHEESEHAHLEERTHHRAHVALPHNRTEDGQHYALSGEGTATKRHEVEDRLDEALGLEDGLEKTGRTLQSCERAQNHDTPHGETDGELGWTKDQLRMTVERLSDGGQSDEIGNGKENDRQSEQAQHFLHRVAPTHKASAYAHYAADIREPTLRTPDRRPSDSTSPEPRPFPRNMDRVHELLCDEAVCDD